MEKSKACQEKAAALEKSRNQKKLLDRMQSEVKQLSVQKYQMNQVIERNNDEKAKILREKTELLLIAIKHNKLMREARERLECPVCLVNVLFLLTFSFVSVFRLCQEVVQCHLAPAATLLATLACRR